MNALPTRLTRDALRAKPAFEVLEAADETLPDLRDPEPMPPRVARRHLIRATRELRHAAVAADDVLTDDAVPSPDAASEADRLTVARLVCELLGALARLERTLRAA